MVLRGLKWFSCVGFLVGSRTCHWNHSECFRMNRRNGNLLAFFKRVRVEGSRGRFDGTTVGMVEDLFIYRFQFL